MAKRKKDRVTEYAKKVVAKKIIAGESVILACKRHLNDLKRSKTKEFKYKWDVEASEEALDLYNELTILEGDEVQTLKTRGFQEFILGSLEGWVEKKTGYVRFREAYIQLARQNGKSFLSGTKSIKTSNFSTYKKGKIICAATKMEQAKIVWEEVEKFILADEDLNEMYKIKRSDYEITAGATGTIIKPIGRDTKSLDGFRSILAIPDELHAHRTNQVYKLLQGGQRKVNNALILAITTAGFDLNSFCYEHYSFCKKVISGSIEKESLFIYIAEMDENDDIWDYHNWVKSNPLLLLNEDDTINMHEVAKMSEVALEAKEKGGSDLMDFMTKWLNIWVSYKDGRYLDAKWLEICACDLTLEDMRGKECYLGIDLSSGGDLTSIALIFPLEDEKVYIYSHSFMPELRIVEHEQTDDAPYRMWVNEGLLTLTTGAFAIKTDYKFIIKHLEDILTEYEINVIKCAYDNHNASAFISDLDFLGCDLVDVPQSARSLNDATVDFKLSMKAGQVLYNRKNKLFKWSAINATITKNSFGEIKVDKLEQENRIDPIDSILDGWKIYFEDVKQNGDIAYVPD
ncbi:TPA: terminase large subunit [Clostridioides difficile]|nr:terminase large subunit [Clostridioides difficile]